MPKWLIVLLPVLMVMAVVPAAVISRARATRSPEPRINLIPDMDYQPKYLPQTRNALFADGRAMRPQPEGTLARGELHEDDHLHRGRTGGDWTSTFPMEVTAAVMERGQERWGIHCAPCHGISGHGDGLVSLAAERLMELGQAQWTIPTSMHDQTVRERPAGHLFNTITHGIRTMPPYGSQIEVADRWAIVAYVRALQRSSASTLMDVPADAREALR